MVLLVLDYIEGRAKFWVIICILNKTFNIWFKSKRRYMYVFIVHIKMALHIKVLVYQCKNVPTQNLNNLFYTAKNTRCQQL